MLRCLGMPRNQVFDPEDREPERDDEPIGRHRPPDDAAGVALDLDFDLDFEEADILEVLDDDDLKQMDGPDA